MRIAYSDLNKFSIITQLPVQWGEMDAAGIVNNVLYARYMESARCDYFEKIGYLDWGNFERMGPVVSEISCKYIFPLRYPDTLSIASQAFVLNDYQFTIKNFIFSDQHRRIAAIGEARLNVMDFSKGEKILVPEKLIELIKKQTHVEF